MFAKREGATMITVVIATAFLIAIGVVILGASTKYLASVYVDRNSNENLYDAEGVLAEVRAGLLEYAGDAGLDAYRVIAENYDTIGFDVTVDAFGNETKTPVTLRDRFAELYLAGIVDRLLGTHTDNEWNDNKWEDTTSNLRNDYKRVKDNLNIASDSGFTSGSPTLIQFNVDNLKKLSTHPDYVSTALVLRNSLFPTGEVAELRKQLGCAIYRTPSKGYFLVIKNMAIDFNEDPFRQTIETDIKISIPDYKFDGDDLLDSASDFIAITDGKIRVEGVGTNRFTSGAVFDGNVYAGGNYFSSGGAVTVGYPDAGIYVATDMKARFNCQKLITRKNLTLMSKADVEVTSPDMSGEAYIKNVKLLSNGAFTSGNGTKLKLKTNSYVENDLDIQDTGTTVELSGTYYGYSYSEDNSASGLPLADYSSAILINGYGTSLLTGEGAGNELSQLILAGRTYVSRNHQSSPFASGGINIRDSHVANDVMMGESIAAKSNQIAYLVPDKYIKAGHNPVSSDYDCTGSDTDFFTPKTLLDTDSSGNIKLMSSDSPLKPYLNETEPVTGNYSTISGHPYVFLYLNFKDQKSANEYFSKFYKDFNSLYPTEADRENVTSPKEVRDRAKVYISSRANAWRISPGLYLIAGNIIRNYDHNATDGFQDANYYQGDDYLQALLDDGERVGKRFVSYAKSLTASEDFGRMRLSDADVPLVSNSSSDVREKPLINPSSIPAASDYTGLTEVALSNGKTAKVYTDNLTTPLSLSSGVSLAEDDTCLLMYNGPVNLDVNCSGLIIANGDVTVTKNFTGLIITTGTIKVENAVNLVSDSILVKELFGFAQSDSQLSAVFPRLTEPVTNNSTDMGECFSYLNWTKNTY